MTVSQLIEKELNIIFPTILQNGKVELSTEQILNSPNSELFEELNNLKGAPGIDEGEWEDLYDFLGLLDLCEDDDAEINIDKEFGRFIKKYPNTLIFNYFRTYYTAMSIITGEFKGEYIPFYKDVLESHPELFNDTSDFFEKSNLLESILLLDNPPDALLNLIENAIKRFSVSNLKFTLAQLLYQKQDYQKALLYFLHFAGQVETEKPLDNYTVEQYHIAISNIANISFYQIKDYETASMYSEVCLSEYERNDDIYAFQYLFLDPMLVRLRLCIYHNDYESFKSDYKLFRSNIDDPDFGALDIDDIKEFANELKM